MITVVGIGADGWDGLPADSRRTVETAEVLMGAPRQLDLVPASAAERVAWPSPLLPALLGAAQVRVLPQVSSLSLACARLGWPVEQVDVVSLAGRPPAVLNAAVLPGRRIIVLGAGRDSPSLVAGLLVGRGYGPSALTVLSDLGAASESVTRGLASGWAAPAGSALNVIAVECAAEPGLLERCWEALRPGGRLVVNAVTLESESVVGRWYGRLGGDLVRLSVQRASPVGGFTGWRAAMPVTVWSVIRKDEP